MNKAQVHVDAGEIRDGDTIYLTVADQWGNMVSLIQSNYRGMGSGVRLLFIYYFFVVLFCLFFFFFVLFFVYCFFFFLFSFFFSFCFFFFFLFDNNVINSWFLQTWALPFKIVERCLIWMKATPTLTLLEKGPSILSSLHLLQKMETLS